MLSNEFLIEDNTPIPTEVEAGFAALENFCASMDKIARNGRDFIKRFLRLKEQDIKVGSKFSTPQGEINVVNIESNIVTAICENGLSVTLSMDDFQVYVAVNM